MDIGICDDDRGVRVSLSDRIRAIAPDASVHLFPDTESLLASTVLPEILFLDVRFAGMDGLEAARRLREGGRDMEIVFISGHPDYVFQSFAAEPLDYLIKPFDDGQIEKVLQRAEDKRARRQKEDPQILVAARGVHTRVRHRDIVYAEVFNRTIVLHTIRGDVSYYGKLQELEETLGADFFRTHRAYLINYRYVDSYTADSCVLGAAAVPIAKKNRRGFVSGYLAYIRRQGLHA